MARNKHLPGILILVIGIAGALALPQIVQGAQLFPTILPNCDQTLDHNASTGFYTIEESNRCNFNHFVQLFVNLFDWGLAVLSILSVTFFIIGGTMLLVSKGKEQTIQSGKSILSNTFLGLMIALGSWVIINTVIGILVGNGKLQNVQVFGENWWGVSTCSEEYSRQCSENNLELGCGDVSTNYVSELQRALNTAGCQHIEVDGCFGPNTQSALKEFNEHQDPPITPYEVAGYDTWQALREGKTCTETAQTTLASGNGCCIPACRQGIPNTAEANNSNGCKDVFTEKVVWDGTLIGGCSEQAMNLNPESCCVDLSGTCYKGANEQWCRTAVVSGGSGGTYYNDCSQATACTSANTLTCN